MTRISKKIGEDRLRDIFDSLTETIANIHNKKSAKKFIQSLLTEPEEIMLSKRLAAIYLFFEGHSEYYISESLGISSSTAARLHKNARTGHYDFLINFFKNQKEATKFGDTLYKILTAGLPPKVGRGRWKYFDKALAKHGKQ